MTTVILCLVDSYHIRGYVFQRRTITRRSKARHIYHKYIIAEAVLAIGGIRDPERDMYHENIELSKDNPSLLTPDFFNKIQTVCFMELYHNIYIPFKNSKEYDELTNKLKEKYNRVSMDDFKFFAKLGEGGFGVVLHCEKKSTGKHYAMKIQTKRGLIDCFKGE